VCDGIGQHSVAVFFVEVLASLYPVTETAADASATKRRKADYGCRAGAQRELQASFPTIEDIKPQLGPRDRLIVVADNCSDDTAVLPQRSEPRSSPGMT